MIFAWAVREVESNEASLITLLEPVAVPIWTFIAWRNYPSYQFPRWWTLVGAALIAAGFVWRYGMLRRSNRQPSDPGDDPQIPNPLGEAVSQDD